MSDKAKKQSVLFKAHKSIGFPVRHGFKSVCIENHPSDAEKIHRAPSAGTSQVHGMQGCSFPGVWASSCPDFEL